MILSLLLFVSSFFTTANRGEQKSHDYSRGVQGQGGTKFRSADCVWFSSCPRTKKATLNEYKKVPSKRLRSNACEKQKATIIVVASKVKEERSSEVQTAFMVITFYLKKLLFQASHCEAMRKKTKKPRL